MELIELVSHDLFTLPIKRGEASLVRTLNNTFAVYLDLLRKLHNSSQFTDTIITQIDDIEYLCNKLISTYKQYLKGSPYKAYLEFSNGISCLEEFLLSHIRERVKYPDSITLFRMRSSNCMHLSLGDIFHIPFEHRGRVNNQRFSINGFPCLYLGSSTYVCWEELKRPNFANTFVSKFRLLTKHPNILDLTFSADEAKHTITKFREEDPFHEWLLYNVIDKVVIYPLIACCSIINEGSSDVFKEEYIIPQVLLEWVRNNSKINAIEYSSLSLPDYNLEHSLYKNYVFPAKRQKASGHCSFLSSIFELTEPISWDFASALCSRANALSSISQSDFNLMGQKQSYSKTQFGQIEGFLDSSPFQKL